MILKNIYIYIHTHTGSTFAFLHRPPSQAQEELLERWEAWCLQLGRMAQVVEANAGCLRTVGYKVKRMSRRRRHNKTSKIWWLKGFLPKPGLWF